MYYDTVYQNLIFTSFNPKIDKQKKDEVINFISKEYLKFSSDIDFTVIALYNNKIVATASLENYILKCFAIDINFRNMGISNKLVKILTEKAFSNNKTHLFVYTKPKNASIFKGLGYNKVVEIDDMVTLLENKRTGFKNYLKNLKKTNTKINSAIVMNCNPFTKGHLFLIEKASKESDTLHLFIVTEDKSEFSTKDRLAMVKKGTSHLKNIVIHSCGKYIISGATFPSYFIKNKENVVKAHSYLDLTLFGKYICKKLNITRRYVGQEPACVVTNNYNAYMKKLLPNYGVKIIEMPRLKQDDKIISASNVRIFLSKNKLDKIKPLVPKTTFEYLLNINNYKLNDK